MLQGYPTKKGTGIRILGDYVDLNQLYATLHKLCPNSGDTKLDPIQGNMLAFAYEVKKAFSGQRITEGLIFDDEIKVDYHGFEYLWTDLLIALNCFRRQAGFITTDEIDQANLYLLEYITKQALEQYDLQGAGILKKYINQQIDINNPLLSQIGEYINIQYLEQKPGKSRFRNIHKLFDLYFSTWTKEYKVFESMVDKSAKSMKCKPLELTFHDDLLYEKIIW